jgi:hypothetical protein
MSDSRDTKIRKAAVIDSSSLAIPFAYIQKQFGFSVDSILVQIHNQPLLDMGTYPDTFPYTISDYYWIYNKPSYINIWICTGKLISGQYFLYSAESNINPKAFLTGDANMHLWVSYQYSDLIHFAMNKTTYELYMSETQPFTE